MDFVISLEIFKYFFCKNNNLGCVDMDTILFFFMGQYNRQLCALNSNKIDQN